MSNYTQIIRQLLWEQYHDHQTQTLVISTLNIKFIPLKAQELLETYSQVKFLTITHCDLRKLQNFPILPSLVDLDISYNSLQGTFNYLMPLKSLKYLNIAHNIISDYNVLQPLRRLGKVEVYLKDNPFTQLNNWKGKMKIFNITVLKEPKRIGKIKEEEVKEQQQKSVEKQKRNVFLRQPSRQQQRRPFTYGSYRQKLMAGLQNNLLLEADQLEAPIPDMRYNHNHNPFQNFQIEQVEPNVNLLNTNLLADEQVESQLGLEMDNDNEDLELADEYVSENFDEDNEQGEEEEADQPYY